MQTLCGPQIEHSNWPPSPWHPSAVSYGVWVSLIKSSQFDQTCHFVENQSLCFKLNVTPHLPSAGSHTTPAGNVGAGVASLWEVWFACWPNASIQFQRSLPVSTRGVDDVCQQWATCSSHQASTPAQLKHPLWHSADHSGLERRQGSLSPTRGGAALSHLPLSRASPCSTFRGPGDLSTAWEVTIKALHG